MYYLIWELFSIPLSVYRAWLQALHREVRKVTEWKLQVSKLNKTWPLESNLRAVSVSRKPRYLLRESLTAACGSYSVTQSKHFNVWLELSCGLVFFETKYIWRDVISENKDFHSFPYRYWPERGVSWLKQWKHLFLPSFFCLEDWWPPCHSCFLLNQEKEMKGNHWYSWEGGSDIRLHLCQL